MDSRATACDSEALTRICAEVVQGIIHWRNAARSAQCSGSAVGPRQMQGMATYHAAREWAAERHIATLALLNGVGAGVLLLVAGWLYWSSRQVSEYDEAVLRMALSTACVGTSFLNMGLAYGLSRFAPAARIIQAMAAVLSLPIAPFGTLWGGYALWALLRRSGRMVFTEEAAHRRREVAHRPPQPYYGAVILAVTVGVAGVTFSLQKSHELWLARKVRMATAHEASQRAALGRSMQRLRDLSADDLANERVKAADLPQAVDDQTDAGTTRGSTAGTEQL